MTLNNIRIYYDTLTGGDYVECNCSRWDQDNYGLTTEFWLTKSQLQTIRSNIRPGATGELFTILGRPTYYDKSWTGDNTLKLSPTNQSELEDMRSDTTIYVRSISDSPVEGDTGWINVKIEGYISGSAL